MNAILEIVERLNGAWPLGDFDALLEIFDPDVVLVPLAPDSHHRVVGREAVIQSYRDFVGEAVIHRFEIDEPDIDLFGTTAIASCPFTIDYEIGGRRWIGTGRELLVLKESDGAWTVVWRGMLSGQEREVGPGGGGP